MIDPRLASALTAQLERWRATLRGGAERVGWKLGAGDMPRTGRVDAATRLLGAVRLSIEPVTTS